MPLPISSLTSWLTSIFFMCISCRRWCVFWLDKSCPSGCYWYAYQIWSPYTNLDILLLYSHVWTHHSTSFTLGPNINIFFFSLLSFIVRHLPGSHTIAWLLLLPSTLTSHVIQADASTFIRLSIMLAWWYRVVLQLCFQQKST